jgi:hypothetical protein
MMKTTFSEHNKGSEYYRYGEHQRIREEVGKNIERTEEEWKENKPPKIDVVRKATERL